ncbi:MAG: fatty acid desaturase [Pirellulaceae bacterium]|nr:fatty acid desaturase [Pirellulaceae bacterium]
MSIAWDYAISIALVHLLTIPVALPWLFSWTGLAACLVGVPLYGILGITLCYHRLLTHQGLVLPKWLEHFCALLGVCTLQDTPARWVAIHRMHHLHSDERPDPHSPLVSFLWAHVGWLVIQHREHRVVTFYEKYARDLLRDPFYFALERRLAWVWIYMAHTLLYFAAGLAIGWPWTGNVLGGVQLGLSLVVWGVFMRTLIIWHGTWSVNSVAHVWGYRNYDTGDDSRNHWGVAVWAFGEGWHNNHHADQRAAIHGHRWWEFDITWQVIRVLMVLGLAKNVVKPRAWEEPEPLKRAA